MIYPEFGKWGENMGKYCGKCGSKLDERTGRCLRCDTGRGKLRKPVFFVLLVLLFAVAVAAGFQHTGFGSGAPEEPENSGEERITVTEARIAETEPAETIPNIEFEIGEWTEVTTVPQIPSADLTLAGVLINTSEKEGADDLVFGASIDKYSIGEIWFLDSVKDAPESSWDASAGRDGTVLAWTEQMGDFSRLYLAAEGGVIAPENCDNLFSGFGFLQKIAFNDAFHTEDTRSMEGMFYWSGLVSLDLSGLDTSSVTNMRSMFGSCRELKTLNIRSLDTSCVTDMSGMFSDCRRLKKLDIRNLDTSSVTDMSGMFGYCWDLQALDVSTMDTSSVEDMNFMFWRCASLEELDLRSFDTSSVKNMSFMFKECDSLRNLNLAGLDISNVTDMTCMFQLCESLETLNIQGWDLSGVEHTEAMFSYCYNLDLLDFELSEKAVQQLLPLLEKHGYYGGDKLEGALSAAILADFDRDGEDELLLNELEPNERGEQEILCRVYDYQNGVWSPVNRQWVLGSYSYPGWFGYGGLTYIRETPALYTYEWKAPNGTGHGPGCLEEYIYTVYDEDFDPINTYSYMIAWDENGEETRTYLMNGKKVDYEYFRDVACGYKGFACEYGDVVNSTLGRMSPELMVELLNTFV